jgi:hypothetical protein
MTKVINQDIDVYGDVDARMPAAPIGGQENSIASKADSPDSALAIVGRMVASGAQNTRNGIKRMKCINKVILTGA